jgi:hypothetical protein
VPADLRAAGDAGTARKLDEKVLADYRKIFGDDHTCKPGCVHTRAPATIRQWHHVSQ